MDNIIMAQSNPASSAFSKYNKNLKNQCNKNSNNSNHKNNNSIHGSTRHTRECDGAHTPPLLCSNIDANNTTTFTNETSTALTAPTPLNNTDKFGLSPMNTNLSNAYESHIVIRSSSQGSSNRPFRVKHLGKRKFQILRPVSLPMDYNDNVNRITTNNNGNSVSSSSNRSSDTATTSRDGIDVTTPTGTSDTNKHPICSQLSIQDGHLVTNLSTTGNNFILQEQCASRDIDCLLDKNIVEKELESVLQQTLTSASSISPTMLSSKASLSNSSPTSIEKLEFIPSEIPNFWHCPNCFHLPLSKRSKHSVIFHHAICSSANKNDKSNCNNKTIMEMIPASSNRERNGRYDMNAPNDTRQSSSFSSSVSALSSSSSKNNAKVEEDATAGHDDATSTYRDDGKNIVVPPSSDTFKIIAIHSYLCQMNEGRMVNSNEGNDDQYKSDENSDTEIYHSNTRQCRKSRRLNQKSEQQQQTSQKKKTNNDRNAKVTSKRKGKENTVLKNITPRKRGRGGPRTNSGTPTRNSKNSPMPSPPSSSSSNKGDCASSIMIGNESSNGLVKFNTPSNSNGLVDVEIDSKSTAFIDMYLMSHVKQCAYIRANDKNFYLRQKPLPEKYPGVQCIFCEKQWFFNSSLQLATGFPKIEQHLTRFCDNCPRNVQKVIAMAKNQEDEERNELRIKSEGSISVTRRHYGQVVIERLGAPKLL